LNLKSRSMPGGINRLKLLYSDALWNCFCKSQTEICIDWKSHKTLSFKIIKENCISVHY
jgi:hypothetical protein